MPSALEMRKQAQSPRVYYICYYTTNDDDLSVCLLTTAQNADAKDDALPLKTTRYLPYTQTDTHI